MTTAATTAKPRKKRVTAKRIVVVAAAVAGVIISTILVLLFNYLLESRRERTKKRQDFIEFVKVAQDKEAIEIILGGESRWVKLTRTHFDGYFCFQIVSEYKICGNGKEVCLENRTVGQF